MSFFPNIFESKSLPDLIELFAGDLSVDREETGLYFQELAIKIAENGKEGVGFLLNSLPQVDGPRLQGVLAAFAFVDKESSKELLPRIKSALASFIAGADPDLVANAVDSANRLGFIDLAGPIRGLLNHESPYVVGSVLRFLSAHFPSDAKLQLLKALKSPQPIIRQNAIDELDELDCKEALPCIAGLVNDPDRNVSEAARWAVAHLESV